MLVFKFGGASVKNAAAVKNVQRILERFENQKLLVVISAMGKMTNKLEEIWKSCLAQNHENLEQHLAEFENFHREILAELFPHDAILDRQCADELFLELRKICSKEVSISEAELYDQIVPFGELVSTKIVAQYLNKSKPTVWIDASTLIQTDSKFRSATVQMEATEEKVSQTIQNLQAPNGLVITQGFIGSTVDGKRTTLGREGSDYSAAIFSFCLDAENLTIWKDVAGMYNADPRVFEDVVKLNQVSYRDAIELSYYGASVIHPKTIQPLQNKNIPLFVKSFLYPEESGTVIQAESMEKVPCFIVKDEQLLISIATRDFSFIAERHLSEIFMIFDQLDLKINIMQNSAVNFSVLVDHGKVDIATIINAFSQKFNVRYNTNLRLITIRHFNQKVIDQLVQGKEVLLEQQTRETVRFVVR